VQTPHKQSVQVKAWFIEGYTYIRDELVTCKGKPSNASVSYIILGMTILSSFIQVCTRYD